MKRQGRTIQDIAGKYLRYHLGWCILGVLEGLKDEQGNWVALNGALVDREVYHYCASCQMAQIKTSSLTPVDLEVIKQRSQVGSCSFGLNVASSD